MSNISYEDVSDEQMLKDLVNEKLTVMLHGKPGCGKTARVKALDPTATVLSLPYKDTTEIMGLMLVDPTTGGFKVEPPVWYTELCKKCADEPNRIHILFLDEITNATPTIQALSYQICLDKIVNDRWKLPENCAIVAAGNEVADSNCAFDMPEPLHSRFAHIYINTNADNWLIWALRNNIHPLIISYVSYQKEKVLYTPYNGEEPNVDPRKWEKASKLLYANGKMQLLKTILGTSMYLEFQAFCKIKMPTIEEVIEGVAKVPNDNASKYATIGALSFCTEKELPPVWEFVSKLEREYQAIFMRLWVRKDNDRFNTFVKLKDCDKIFENIEKDAKELNNGR